jgi:ketosteroid isomerase-like protein
MMGRLVDHNKVIFGEADEPGAAIEGFRPRMPEPTGRDFDVEQIWIFTLTDGLITEIRAVSDRLGMFVQLGWDWPAAG